MEIQEARIMSETAGLALTCDRVNQPADPQCRPPFADELAGAVVLAVRQSDMAV